jgi:Rrf2 family protein
MRLTSRIDYGLRAMLDLALHAGGGPVANHDISRRQRIPEQYLKQILPALRREGLVVSTRGPNGGHRLARRPDEVTVAEVLKALEGRFEVVGAGKGATGGESARILAQFWGELSQAMEQVLEGTTLDDLCRKKRRHDQSLIYQI